MKITKSKFLNFLFIFECIDGEFTGYWSYVEDLILDIYIFTADFFNNH